VGGTSIIDRRDGATYRASWAGAVAGHPAALGIISWNEFSENSQIEPSKTYGYQYLDLTGQLTGRASGTPAPAPVVTTVPGPVVDPAVGGTDSSELPPRTFISQQLYSLLITVGLLAIVAFSSARARARSRR
jgi:hypothetical protein